MTTDEIDMRKVIYGCVAETGANIASVQKVLKGLKVRGAADRRIRVYLEHAGVAIPTRSPQAPAVGAL